MSKEIQIFANDQFGEVRTLIKDGETAVCRRDVKQKSPVQQSARCVGEAR